MADRVKGITVEIGGDTTKLDKALGDVNQQIRGTQTGLRDVERLLKMDSGNTELIAQKQKLLTDQLKASKEKAALLNRALAETPQDVFDRQPGSLDKIKRELIATEQAMQQTQSALDEIGSASANLKDLASNAEDAADGMDDLGKESKECGTIYAKLGDIVKGTAIGNLISEGVKAGIAAMKSLIQTIWNLDEATTEYRDSMSKMQITAENWGVSVGVAKEAFQSFYEVVGDNGAAVEAVNNLTNAGMSAEQMAKAVDLISGAVVRFPDTMKIESLADSLQETLATREAAGQFSEMLSRAGINLNDFNNKLSDCYDWSERVDLVLSYFPSSMQEAIDSWRSQNAVLIESRDNQIAIQDAMSKVGEVITKIKNAFMTQFAPIMTQMAEQLSHVVDAIDWEEVAKQVGEFLQQFDFQAVLEGLGSLIQSLVQIAPLIGSILKAAAGLAQAWLQMSDTEKAVTALGTLAAALATVAVVKAAVTSGAVGAGAAAALIVAAVAAVGGTVLGNKRRAAAREAKRSGLNAQMYGTTEDYQAYQTYKNDQEWAIQQRRVGEAIQNGSVAQGTNYEDLPIGLQITHVYSGSGGQLARSLKVDTTVEAQRAGTSLRDY